MHALPPDIQVLERGWLSANTVVLRGDARGAVLVDTGYYTHKRQTLALVQECLRDEARTPRLILNTHLHSDHCGGNALLAEAFGCPIGVPPGQYQAACDWDEAALSYQATGQQCERFYPTTVLQPGEHIEQAGRQWHVLAAPGHDPHSIILFEPQLRILISADALWEHGFGIVFPELEGADAFHEVEQTLELIASLPVRAVIPGHGPPFEDISAALERARSRLTFFRQYPERHARHAAKALLMFHMLACRCCTRSELAEWLSQVPLHQLMWSQYFSHQSMVEWTDTLVHELVMNRSLKLNAELLTCN